MNIDTELKLDFSDVLIRPKRSTLESRSQVNLSREFTPKYGTPFSGVPIIAANMSTGTFEMLSEFAKHGMFVAIAKFLNHRWVEEVDKNPVIIDYGFYTIGMSYEELGGLKEYHSYVSGKYGKVVADNVKICVDIANGYTQRFASFVSDVRREFPTNVIMAGNVATPEMTQELIINGADYVKVGIGPGCGKFDSRILMSNGSYKNIIDVIEGDRVINMNGKPVTVKKSFTTGKRDVINIRHNTFYKDNVFTPDHQYYIGDLSTTSESTIKGKGYAKLLLQESKTMPKQTKFKWKAIGDVDNKKMVGLIPNNIQWELPNEFEYDISEYFIDKSYLDNYNTIINSTYDLGYLFGFFVGDGTQTINKRHNGFISFACYKEDIEQINKLKKIIFNVTGKEPIEHYQDNVVNVKLLSTQWSKLFKEFGKRTEKHLPEQYYCLNKDYLQGLYDGMIDSDGNIESNGIETHNDRHRFTNTSPQLIELFGFLTYNLFGYFPEYSNGNISSSDLVTGVNDAYRVKHTLNGQLSKRVVNDFQVVKISSKEYNNEVTDVYDLEIDDDTHSFIANNMIVHNSHCSTRRQTGIGYPQLSAIIECADAAHGLDGGIVADGGVRTPGDVAKALCANGDMVMIGGMFAGTDECYGDIVTKWFENPEYYQCMVDGVPELLKHEPIDKQYKIFYGMSSEHAQDAHMGGMKEYRASEGVVSEVEYTGPVSNIVKDLLGSLRSTGTYIGADKVKNFGKCATFVRTNQVHDRNL